MRTDTVGVTWGCVCTRGARPQAFDRWSLLGAQYTMGGIPTNYRSEVLSPTKISPPPPPPPLNHPP